MCYLKIIENKVIEDNTSILKKYNDVNENEIVDETLKYIKSNYMKDFSLENLADEFYVHPMYLSRLIKSSINKPFIKVLNEYRLGKAAWYLGTSNKKVLEISDMVGVKDARYFSFLFKKHYGMTPLQYREHIRNLMN